jgi:hypothetical protein
MRAGGPLSEIWRSDRGLTALLVFLVLGILVALPLISSGALSPMLFDVALGLILISGVASVAGRRTIHRVQGAVAAYLLLGLAWSFAYELAMLGSADAVHFADATGFPAAQVPRLVYFSFVTLTTLGYGDIVPVSPAARSLAVTEALIGQLFPAILIARLVSLEISSHRDR